MASQHKQFWDEQHQLDRLEHIGRRIVLLLLKGEIHQAHCTIDYAAETELAELPPLTQEEIATMSGHQKANLVDMLANATQSDLDEIDGRIRELQEEIDKLQRTRKVLAKVVGKSDSATPRVKVTVGAIIEDLREHGPSTSGEVANRLGAAPQAIGRIARSSKSIKRTPDNRLQLR